MVRKFNDASELLTRFQVEATAPLKKAAVQTRLLTYIFGACDKSSLVRVGLYSNMSSAHVQFSVSRQKSFKLLPTKDNMENCYTLTTSELQRTEKEFSACGVDLVALFGKPTPVKRIHEMFVMNISYAATFSMLPNFRFRSVSFCEKIPSLSETGFTFGTGPQYLCPDRTFFFDKGAWFLEVDKNTEGKKVIAAKVMNYSDYLCDLPSEELSATVITLACFSPKVRRFANGVVVSPIDVSDDSYEEKNHQYVVAMMKSIRDISSNMNFVSCSFHGMRLICVPGDDLLFPQKYDDIFLKECNSIVAKLNPLFTLSGLNATSYKSASSMTIQTEFSGLVFPCSVDGEVPIVYELLTYDACAAVRLRRLLLCKRFVLDKPALVVIDVRRLDDAVDFMKTLNEATKEISGIDKLRWRSGVSRAYGIRFDEDGNCAYMNREGGFLFVCDGIFYAVDDVLGRCCPVSFGYLQCM